MSTLDIKAIRRMAEAADHDGRECHPTQVIALCHRVDALEDALQRVRLWTRMAAALKVAGAAEVDGVAQRALEGSDD